MEHKRLGIIGGMGPKATADFMNKIVEHTAAERDQDHIDMVILNHATLPDRTEMILTNRGSIFLTAIEKDIRLLEHAGVSNIAIPCNTSHYFYKELQAMTDIHIINIVDETLEEISRIYGSGSKIGVLATTGTLRSGIYMEASRKYNIQLHVADESIQQQVMNIIYHDIKKGLSVSSEAIELIIRDLVDREHCECVILACTELSSLTFSKNVRGYYLDAMDVLVKKSIELSGKRMINLMESIAVESETSRTS